MKMIASAIVTVFAAAALANPPAAAPAPAAKETKPAATATTTTPAATATTAKADDKCAGKTGKDLETCKAEMKKTTKK